MSRLSIDLTDRQHRSLKAQAALEGKSIKEYALERLRLVDDGDRAWEELGALLRERIAGGLSGKVSAKSVAEITDEELGRDLQD